MTRRFVGWYGRKAGKGGLMPSKSTYILQTWKQHGFNGSVTDSEFDTIRDGNVHERSV